MSPVETGRRLRILALPGDGIGPEVVREGLRVLRAVCDQWGHELEVEQGLIGAAALRATGSPLPAQTIRLAAACDATLLGAVGDPSCDGNPPALRPEKGLLDLRSALGVWANLRPVKARPALADASPLKDRLLAGVDMLIVRELGGGLYYGQPRGVSGEGGGRRAVDTMAYGVAEIERVARLAFQLARGRRGKVTSVDKANVLACSRLWREVVTAVGADYPDVTLEHALIDSCAMQLVTAPARFDVVLTENMFGDILSDEAAVLAGSIGLLPSASLGGARPGGGPAGLFEPIHGSAPDLAGRSRANPLGTILSVAMLLEHAFGLRREAAAVERAVGAVVESGRLTADLRAASTAASTEEVGGAVVSALEAEPRGGAW